MPSVLTVGPVAGVTGAPEDPSHAVARITIVITIPFAAVFPQIIADMPFGTRSYERFGIQLDTQNREPPDQGLRPEQHSDRFPAAPETCEEVILENLSASTSRLGGAA